MADKPALVLRKGIATLPLPKSPALLKNILQSVSNWSSHQPAGFLAGAGVQLIKNLETLPITRDYMLAEENRLASHYPKPQESRYKSSH